jgi:hypothetical protein
MRTSNVSRKSVSGGKALKAGNGSAAALTAKLRKKWQFAPEPLLDQFSNMARRIE